MFCVFMILPVAAAARLWVVAKDSIRKSRIDPVYGSVSFGKTGGSCLAMSGFIILLVTAALETVTIVGSFFFMYAGAASFVPLGMVTFFFPIV